MTAPSLIERLEGAETGGWELDARVWCFENGPEFKKMLTVPGFPGRHFSFRTSVGDIGFHGRDQSPVHHYTTSLDAALALADRVVKASPKADHDKPEIRITTGDFGANVYIDPDTFRGDVLWFGSAATPALALCAAILRARKDTL